MDLSALLRSLGLDQLKGTRRRIHASTVAPLRIAPGRPGCSIDSTPGQAGRHTPGKPWLPLPDGAGGADVHRDGERGHHGRGRRTVAGAFFMAMLATAAHAQSALAPGESAPPPQHPDRAEAAPDAAREDPAATSEPGADAAAVDAATENAGAAEAELPPEPPVPERLAESDLELGTCLGRLAAYGTVFERGSTISEEGGACGIVNPLRVTEIVPGVALEPAGIMRCDTAAALAEWVSAFVVPASRMLPDRGPVRQITQGSTYICRNVNNADEGGLSEHSFGNAVDVMSFLFATGAQIPVQPREREGTPAEAFQNAVRAAACLSFGTVIGPGQPAHDDHLHLDIEAREGGFRLCQ